MTGRLLLLALGLLAACRGVEEGRAPAPRPAAAVARADGGAGARAPLPEADGAFRAEGSARRFDPRSIFDYLDGGAEAYLAFGMRSLVSQRYVGPGEPALTFDLFDMGTAAGAYGIFAFERDGAEAGVGEGSEQGGGLLRFWQGRYFGAILAERESPGARAAAVALARRVASAVPAAGGPPALVRALPAAGLAAPTVRYLPRAGLVDHELHPSARGPFERGPAQLALGAAEVIVMGRYAPPAEKTRVIVARLANPAAAGAVVAALVAAAPPTVAGPAPVWERAGRAARAEATGRAVVLVLEAPTPERAATLAAAARDLLRSMP